jgi:hypothetical protein
MERQLHQLEVDKWKKISDHMEAKGASKNFGGVALQKQWAKMEKEGRIVKYSSLSLVEPQQSKIGDGMEDTVKDDTYEENS